MNQTMIRLLILPLLLSAMSMGLANAKDEDAERRKPPTQKTEKLSPKVYEKLTAAQAALDEKKAGEALAILNELMAENKLNDYEKAQIFNFYAAVHYESGDIDATIEDYKKILKLEKIPPQIKDNALFRLAQLYFVKEDYEASIRILDVWAKTQESVSPDAHMLKAQAYYQLEDYEGSKQAALQAIREARRRKQAPRENWLALLRAAYYELDDYPSAARLLEVLIKQYPKPGYYKQLSGMYGLMENQKQQLYVMHAAYVSGMLTNEAEILNMARLYMAEDAPSPAITVMQDAMEKGLVDKDEPDNLQLLGQAMALAQEHEAQIPVLQKLAEKTGEARHYLYLGQAQIALGRWQKAAESLRKALQGDGLENRGNVKIQLGMALFNAGKLKEARRVFINAIDDPDVGDTANNWVKYVDSEIKRMQAMIEG